MDASSNEKTSKRVQWSSSTSANPGAIKDEDEDVFVERPDHDIHYKTLSWQASWQNIMIAPSYLKLICLSQFVSLLMIAEIVSNGMLSLPSALAVVGDSRMPGEQCTVSTNTAMKESFQPLF